MLKKFTPICFLMCLTFSVNTCAHNPGALDAIVAKDGHMCANLFQDAIRVNMPHEAYGQSVSDELSLIVAAIRYAENGGPGKEYGILHPKCPDTYRGQAGWCAATVFKNFGRYLDTKPPHPVWMGDFIKFLGAAYAPVGADNDPNGLNSHWVKNVTFFYEKFAANLD